MACVYRDNAGWALRNYGEETRLGTPHDAGAELLKWIEPVFAREGRTDAPAARWLIFETTNFKRVRF
jgi:hypothetical protein